MRKVRITSFHYERGAYDGFVPERVLMAAVLEQSYRDLSIYCERHIRSAAISWFRSEVLRPKGSSHFTYLQIADELCLNRVQRDIIARKVELAAHFNLPPETYVVKEEKEPATPDYPEPFILKQVYNEQALYGN